MSTLALLLLLLTSPARAQEHPLAKCEAKRGAIPHNTTVTLFCGPLQVASRRYGSGATADVRLEAFRGEIALVAESIGAKATWNVAPIELGGARHKVAQYTLKGENGVMRTGLVVPAARDTDLVECSSSEGSAAGLCPEVVAALLTHGLPPGVDYLPLAGDVRRATVLGQAVRVVPGCKAQWVFDEAIHVVCADGELVFGSKAELSAEGLGPDPVDSLHEQVGGAERGKERACTAAGRPTQCWSVDVREDGATVRITTARPRVGGHDAVLACTYTAVGAEVHPLCAQLLAP